ncbi:MAG: phosphatase PAP2 family protein [Pseudoxanthomonas sp.]
MPDLSTPLSPLAVRAYAPPLDPLLWVPLLLAVAAVALLQGLGLDLALADRLYAWEGGRWAFEKAWWSVHLFHRGGRDLVAAGWLAVLGLRVAAQWSPRLAPWRRALDYLLVASLAGPLLVAWLKHWTDVACPVELSRYGGSHPYVELLQSRPPGYGAGRCFPAGHASAGYGWLALFFALAAAAPRWRHAGLALGLTLGVLFGMVQQLRGQHFLSHDVAALAVCWCSARLLQRWLLPEAGAPQQ